MKAALLAAVLLMASAALAQQPPSSDCRDAACRASETGQAPSLPPDATSPAPQLGHPLDPADVDVLTGKNKPESRRGYAQPYYSVDPYGYSGNSGYRGMSRNFGQLNRRTPLGFVGAGSGLMFFGRSFFNPRPVIVFRP